MRSNRASLPGSQVEYVVNDQAKRYTMRDNAFNETKNGNFQYQRILSTVPTDKTAPKLKITVSKDFSVLKINTVTSNGMKKIDLYKKDSQKNTREIAEYVLNSLIEEKVLQLADDQENKS